MNLYIISVKTQCQQYEAEKKYLESELQKKGRHVLQPTKTSSATDDSSVPTSKAPTRDDQKASPSHRHREINIIEDLEKENLFGFSSGLDKKDLTKNPKEIFGSIKVRHSLMVELNNLMVDVSRLNQLEKAKQVLLPLT